MSTTIDERVLEMRFDNRQFENNVSTTMSTLDKLKQKLNFTGASKGLENVNAAAKNVNMTGLGSAVETVSAKFSAMQVIGVTALANITNSAVNAGKRIVSALTIDPIKSGFQEYETQINAVQTILANTSSKGTTIDDVNRALEELNKYADMTIYNFTEMTRNIGTFTAAGVDLETSTNAIKGIANLAAVSGSTSQQASTAMYQLSQALASGTVKLMDWNSVVNAGMGGEVFQNALKETARVHGVAIDEMIESEGSFRETLKNGWLSSDILTETLQKFTLTTEGLTAEQIEANREMLRAKGYTEAQIEEIFKLGNTATDAATKVKTFTQLWDVMKESAQSGWSQTWKLIIGDFEEAKALLTPLANFLTGIINKTSDFRNAILESALGRGFEYLSETISKVVTPAKKVADALETVSDAGEIVIKNVAKAADLLDYYQHVVNMVWRGDYKNSDTGRYDLLDQAGYDHRIVQDLVNKGYQYKLTVDDIATSYAKFGYTVEGTFKTTEGATEATEAQSEATNELTDAQKDQLKYMGRLSDATLKAMGYAPEQIAALKELKAVAEDLGIPFNDFIDNLDQINGRWLLMDGIKNMGQGLVDVGKAIGQAWQNVFPEHTIENFADKLFNLLGGFHKLSSTMVEVFYRKTGETDTGEAIYKLTDAGEKLVRTFEGAFAIIDIVTTVAGGGLKIAFKVLSEILSHFDLDILDVTAAIADAIVGFRNWIDSVIDVGKAVGQIIPAIQNAIKEIKNWFESLKTSDNLPADIVSGLVNGLRSGVGMVWDAAVALATSIVDSIKSFLGIHSPSTVMTEVGENTVAGLKNGLLGGEGTLGEAMRTLGASVVTNVKDGIVSVLGALWSTIKTLGSAIATGFTKAFEFVTGKSDSLDLSETFSLAPAGEMLAKVGEKIASFFKKVYELITTASGKIDWNKVFSGGILVAIVYFLKKMASVANVLDGFGELLEGAGEALNALKSTLKSYSLELKASALQKLAVALLILVAAVVVLASIEDTDKLWNAVSVVFALAIILGVLAWALGKINSVDIDLKDKKVSGLQSGLMQIGIVLLMLAAAIKMVGDMDPAAAEQGFAGLAAMVICLLGFVWALGALTKDSKNISQVGGLMIKLSIAMMLMVGVIKLIDGISLDEAGKAVLFATAFGVFVVAITKVAKSSGNNVSKVGGLMLKLAVAMGLMVGVVKLVSLLSLGEMLKGAVFAAAFTGFVWALVRVTKVGKKQQIAQIGGLVLSLSFSLMLMAGVCKLISSLTYGELLKGAIFVGAFMVMLKTLIQILNVGSEAKLAKISGTILAMAVAIGILAAIAVALSFVDVVSLAKGIIAVGALATLMTMMVKGLKGAQNVKGAVMMMAIAIGVMAASIVALSMIDDTRKLLAAAGALAVVMGMFALIEKCAPKINKSIPTLIVMTAVVAALAYIVYKLSNGIGNPDAAISSVTAIGVLMVALAGSLRLIKSVGSATGMTKAIGAMAGMSIIVGLLGVIMSELTKLNINMSLETVLSLSILLIAMAGVTAICSTFGKVAHYALLGVGALLVAIVAIGALMVGIGALVTKYPQVQTFLDNGIPVLQQIGEGIGRFIGGFVGGIGEGLMDSVLDMTEILGQIVDKLVEVSGNGTNIKTDGLDGMLDLIKVLAGVAAVTVGTNFADMINGWFGDASSMDKFKTDSVAFFEAMKEIGEASVGITIDQESFEAVVKAGQELADLQSCIEPIGGLASKLKGFTDLGTFGGNVKTFIESMKEALDSLWDYQFNKQTFDEVVAAATKLTELQSAIEPIKGLAGCLRGFDDLGTFGGNVKTFIESMKEALDSLWGYQFDAQTLDEVIAAATKLTELQGCIEPIGGLNSVLKGFTDLGTFGNNVKTFATSMKTALESLWDFQVDLSAVDNVIAAAGKLNDFQTELEPMGDFITWFTGRTDLGTFGTNVGLFADGMTKLKQATGITEEGTAGITAAGEAILALQEALPTTSWFDGKMDLEEFSGYITDFSTAMGSFGTAAASIDTAAVDTTVSTAYRIKDLIEALVGLDTSGLETFTGIGTGGLGADGAASKIAQTITEFSSSVSSIDTTKLSTSITSAIKLRDLISSLSGLDTSGVENFKPDSIGSSIGSYYENVSSVDTDLVSRSIACGNLLRSMITSLVGIDASGVSNFKIEPIGSAIKTYGGSVASVDTGAVSKSIDLATRLRAFISSLASLDTKGVDSFKSAIVKLSSIDAGGIGEAFSKLAAEMPKSGAAIINGLIQGVESSAANVITTLETLTDRMFNTFSMKEKEFKTVGETIGKKIAKGISDTKKDVKNSVSDFATAAVDKLETYYYDFKDVGKYMVDGFAQGIKDKTWLGESAARELAKAAIRAAKKQLDINSPSKVFRDIGMGVPEGFALGVEKYSGLVDDSIVEMTDSAIGSVGNTISRLADVINSDIDAQPTIRPVLDLSDVEAGASTIGNLFDTNSRVGVMANLGTVGAMMGRYGQNGGNSDIIGAIDKLRKDLGNISSNTYQINGVTYDDGSNIADAVRTITRAAVMERRM